MQSCQREEEAVIADNCLIHKHCILIFGNRMSKEEDPKDKKPTEVKKEVPSYAKFIISGLGAYVNFEHMTVILLIQ